MVLMPSSKVLLLLCLAGLSLLAMHVQADSHAVAVVPTPAADDGGQSAPSTTSDVVKTAIFEPTHEWKEVQPHEHIPGGLHIRMNLQTGKKEAKYLDDDESHKSSDGTATPPRRKHVISSTDIYHIDATSSGDNGRHHTDESGAVVDSSGNVIGESLYNVLAQLPEPPQLDGMDIHEAYGKLTKEQFSAYIAKVWKARQEELKEASAQIRDEVKHMQGLIETLVTPKTGDVDVHEANVVDALQHLEWEVQDLDKAKDFNTLGGLEATVRHLNASSYRVRTMAAWVVGSAVKHYDQAQGWALQAGAMPLVLQSLAIDPADADDDDARSIVLAMQKKMLYALSALTEANEKAQRLFLHNSGVAVVTKILQSSDRPVALQHKALQLALHFLLEGQATAVDAEAPHPLHALHQAFRSAEFCDATKNFLQSQKLTVRQQVDAVELISLQLPACAAVYDPALRPTIHSLNATWFGDADLDNELKADSMRKLALLGQALDKTTSAAVHEEL